MPLDVLSGLCARHFRDLRETTVSRHPASPRYITSADALTKINAGLMWA
jgi:hypothetical protein